MKNINYNLVAMRLIQNTKAFESVSINQIETLANFIKIKMGEYEKINYNEIIKIVKGTK
jgi:hypothetical protein